MRCHRVSETLACYLKYLVDCSIVQVNQLRLRVPESSRKLGLLLRVSRRHIARQSSHISDILVFLKCLSAMCTKMVSKKYRSTSFLWVLACYIKVSRRLLYCTSEPASFKSSRKFSKTRLVTLEYLGVTLYGSPAELISNCFTAVFEFK